MDEYEGLPVNVKVEQRAVGKNPSNSSRLFVSKLFKVELSNLFI